MINRYKIQQILFLIVFLNCCAILCLTIISMSTDHWVTARPYRKMPSFKKFNSILKHQSTTTKSSDIVSGSNLVHLDNDDEYLSSDEIDEDDTLLPIDLHAKNDCKRYSGKIRFGLFKGVWLLNYAFGCKNRINKVSSKKFKKF